MSSSNNPVLAASTSEAGKVISHFKFGMEIGRGSFANVYKGTDLQSRKTVAIKSVFRSRLKNQKLISNLEIEIKILRNLKNPHIVSLLDCVKTDNHIHLIMDYCSLGDLSYFIRKKDQLADCHPIIKAVLEKYPSPPNLNGLNQVLVINFIKQLASALQFLRSQNLIHRDIKPQNLLLCTPAHSKEQFIEGGYSGFWELPILKVADFGFARYLPSTSMAETLCGSPLYMAPEILRYEKYNAKADLWSVGAVIYEMAVGKPPFRASNHIELLKRIEKANDQIKFPKELEFQQDLIHLISNLLKANPIDRMGFDEFFNDPIIVSTKNLVESMNESLSYSFENEEMYVSEFLNAQNIKQLGEISADKKTKNNTTKMLKHINEKTKNSTDKVVTAISNVKELGKTKTLYAQSNTDSTTVNSTPLNKLVIAEEDENQSESVEQGEGDGIGNNNTTYCDDQNQIQTSETSNAISINSGVNMKSNIRSNMSFFKSPASNDVTKETVRTSSDISNANANSNSNSNLKSVEALLQNSKATLESAALQTPDLHSLNAHMQKTSGCTSSNATKILKKDLIVEKDYVVVEKRNVEINTFADEVKKASFTIEGRKLNSGSRRYSLSVSPSTALKDVIDYTSGKLFGLNNANTNLSNVKTAKPLTGFPKRMGGEHIKHENDTKRLINITNKQVTGTSNTKITDEDEEMISKIERLAMMAHSISIFGLVKFNQVIPLPPSTIDDTNNIIDPYNYKNETYKIDNEKDNLDSESCRQYNLVYKRLCQEGLVLYLKVLSMLSEAIKISSEWWSRNKLKSNITPKIGELIQWIRNKFNESLEKAEYLKLRINRFEEENANSSSKEEEFVCEKIIFDRSIEISKNTAIRELKSSNRKDGDISELKACEVAYSLAVWMLESLIYKSNEDEGLTGNDAKIVENFINSIGTRLLILRGKIDRSL